MKLLKLRMGFRTSFLSATSLFCIVLTTGMVEDGSSNELSRNKPSVVLQASTTSITLPCPAIDFSISGSCPQTADPQVSLLSTTRDLNKQSLYTYTVTEGRVVGEGSKVTWDLSNVGPGLHTATVEVKDNKKHRAFASVIVKIVNCPDCVPNCGLCPQISMACPDEVEPGTPVTFSVAVGGPGDLASAKWSVRDANGKDLSGRISGQGGSISVSTEGLSGQNLTATIEVGGLDPACGRTASCSVAVKP